MMQAREIIQANEAVYNRPRHKAGTMHSQPNSPLLSPLSVSSSST